MRIRNIRPFEACRFNVGTQGFHGLCSFCGKVYQGATRAAVFMGTSADGKTYALCHYHGKQAIFDDKERRRHEIR